MKNLIHINTFAEVVRAGSFAAAARAMGIPRSTVSLHIAKLEQSLGTRLLKRSTRAISLTEAGRKLFDESAPSLSSLQRTLNDFEQSRDTFEGTIRVTAPSDFPTGLLAGAVHEFQKNHPHLEFDLLLSNSKLDFVQDRVDIAIGFSARTDGGRVCRTVAHTKWGFFVSEDFVTEHGEPHDLESLRPFIAPNSSLQKALEQCVLGGRSLPEGQLMANNQLLIRDLVLRGAGAGLLPVSLVSREVASGTVRQCLKNLVVGELPLLLEFPSRQDILPKTREFAAHFGDYLRRAQAGNV